MNHLKRTLLLICLIPLSIAAQDQKQVGPAMQKQTAEKVSDSELSTFAGIYKEVNMISQAAQQKMVKKVQSNGFKLQNFQQLQQKQQKGEKLELTEEKEKNFNKTNKELQTIQQNTQQKAVSTIKEGGLTLQRYQQIIAQLRQDQALQQKLKSKMQPQKNAPTGE